MAKVFNVTTVCRPQKHYMVSLDGRLRAMKELADNGMYFIINKARQYGKTTILRALNDYLQDDYYVVLMDFQTFGSAKFKSENAFSLSFASSFIRLMNRNRGSLPPGLSARLSGLEKICGARLSDFELKELFESLSDICASSDKPIILMIDEVDSAANNLVFLDFLAQLRAYYIDRDHGPAFQSVILAGVYDIKNLARKIRPDEDHKVNSPWNVAADFHINMSFSAAEIAGMLCEYEADYHTGMDTETIAEQIYYHTSGYPFLVSRLCQLLDETVSMRLGSKSEAWSSYGIIEACRILTTENNTLFESMIGKITNYPELKHLLERKVFNGQTVSYTATNEIIRLGTMFGIIKNVDNAVAPANRIFARVLADYFLSMDELKETEIYKASIREKHQFVTGGRLDMRAVMERFIVHFTELYGNRGERFIEEEGRKYFLLYLRPIINGSGYYSMEAVTGSGTRTDVIVYYYEELFIIETKIWHGPKRNEDARNQLMGYMDSYCQKTGYLLTFSFNKTKMQGIKEVRIGDKLLIEAVV